MLSHYNLVSNIYQAFGVLDDIVYEDVQAGVLPFFHIFGLQVLLNMAYSKGKLFYIL
jgi:long-subunit acyl-CoA synthetase (AMP-forming)